MLGDFNWKKLCPTKLFILLGGGNLYEIQIHIYWQIYISEKICQGEWDGDKNRALKRNLQICFSSFPYPLYRWDLYYFVGGVSCEIIVIQNSLSYVMCVFKL